MGELWPMFFTPVAHAAKRRRRRHLTEAAAAENNRSARRRRRSKSPGAPPPKERRRRRALDLGVSLYNLFRYYKTYVSLSHACLISDVTMGVWTSDD